MIQNHTQHKNKESEQDKEDSSTRKDLEGTDKTGNKNAKSTQREL